MVCPPSSGSCLPLSPIVPLFVSLCWILCPPSRGSGLPSSPFLFPFVGWCVRLPDILVSPCLPHCFPLLDASAFPWPCLPLSPFLNPCVGWCVRLPGVLFPLFSHGLPACFSLLDSVCAFPACLPACLPDFLPHCFPLLDGVSAFPTFLSPLVSLLVSLCWMARPPSPGLVSPCLPSCFHVLDGASTFPGFGLPLSPFLIASLCWIMCRPSQLVSQLVFQLASQLVSQLFSLIPLLDGVSAFPRLCLSLSPSFSPRVLPPFVSHCAPSCFPLFDGVTRGLVSPCLPSCFPLLGGVSAFPRLCRISRSSPSLSSFLFPFV